MPDNNTFFSKLTSINFTIKNLSPNRKIHVFNYPIYPGQTRDLLAIPEISENDIRHSLIKGELANFIRMQVIQIVSTSIDLEQDDPQQLEFINSAGASTTNTEPVGSIIFGGGSSGSAIFDGIKTHQCASLSGNVYTVIQDTFLSDGTIIYPGITLYSNGYRIFCNGTMTNNGTIHNDGYGATGAIAGTTSAGVAASQYGTVGSGTAGGNGRSNNTGLNGTTQSNGLYGTSAVGGAGGNGGANNGGNGGTYTLNVSGNGGANYLMPLHTGYLFGASYSSGQPQLYIIGGGAGGGGGGSDSISATGGGGGGGGGVLALHVLNLINNGSIHSNGGNGGKASGVSGNAGGGGGGAGGTILQLSRFYSGTGTITVNGGLGGTGIGTGAAGFTGHVGSISQHIT